MGEMSCVVCQDHTVNRWHGRDLRTLSECSPTLYPTLYLPIGSVKEARHKRHTVCDSSSMKCPELTNLETERKSAASRAGREEVTANGCGGKKAMELEGSDGYTTL